MLAFDLVRIKNVLMQQDKIILSRTTDLLANGGFSHLKDDQLSALHHQLLRLREPLSMEQENHLLKFWANADATHLPEALVYRCNMVLQQRGFHPICELYTGMEAE